VRTIEALVVEQGQPVMGQTHGFSPSQLLRSDCARAPTTPCVTRGV
jgi:hypothetical protein